MAIKQFNSIAGYSIGGDPSPITVVDSNANVTANTLIVNANASITGNITAGNANLGNLATANFFQGDGGLLTNIATTAGSSIVNGTSNVAVGLNGNVTVSVAGTANVLVVTASSANISGTANVTGKIIVGTVAYANTDGTSGQVLTTYGNGTTYWSSVSAGSSSSIANGTSNVNIATTGGNVTTSVNGTSNVIVASTTGVNVTGMLNATGGLISRVVSIADGTSITLNADITDLAVQINTQATGTLTINAPTGTIIDGQKVMLRINSTNTQTFSWNSVFSGSTDMALPTTTSGSSLTDYMGFIYDSSASKWQMIAKNFGF